MALTLAETVVRNWERKRRRLQARREGRTVTQLVTQEHDEFRAQKLAGELAPHLSDALTVQISQSLRGCLEEVAGGPAAEPIAAEAAAPGPVSVFEEATEPDAGKVSVSDGGFRSLGDQLAEGFGEILDELKALREALGARRPAAAEDPEETDDAAELKRTIDRMATDFA